MLYWLSPRERERARSPREREKEKRIFRNFTFFEVKAPGELLV